MGLTLTDTSTTSSLFYEFYAFISYCLYICPWIMSDKPKKAIQDNRGRLFHMANIKILKFLFWN